MVEFQQKIDYSMPRQCGIFPPPPIHYKNARGLVILFQCPSDVKKQNLPPELEPVKRGLDVILILEYPDTSIGPYNEMIIGLNCKYEKKAGQFVYNIYVDDDVALTAGREIWGYPKKMCEIKFSSLQGNEMRATLTRKGVTFLDVEVELLETSPAIDAGSTFEQLPFYNLKFFPDVSDNTKPAFRQLTETQIEYGDFHKMQGAKINYVKSQYSQYDICHELLKNINKYLGAAYIEFDFTLPNGKGLD